MRITVQELLMVTGAGSGIGRAAAVEAAKVGWDVLVTDIDLHDADETADLIHRSGGVAQSRALDVADDAAVAALFDELSAKDVRRLRGLFTSAGIDLGGMAHELEAATWRRVQEVNTTGTFLVVQQALRHMSQGAGGSVVMCSSPAAVVGFAAGGATAYGASKGAIDSMTRTLAVDYAKYGIRVNAVVPGPTETPLMWASVAESDRLRMREQIESEVPLGRMAAPAEIGRVVVWLLSDSASYTTGSLIRCDGGVLAKSSISI